MRGGGKKEERVRGGGKKVNSCIIVRINILAIIGTENSMKGWRERGKGGEWLL